MSLNRVILMGHLTRDPEVKYTPSGTVVCKFTLALNNKYVSNGATKEDVTFVDVVAWNKQAETLNQYIKKGNALIVEGRLSQQRWETEDGQKRSKIEVVLQSFTFLPKSKTETNNDNQNSNLEDVPF